MHLLIGFALVALTPTLAFAHGGADHISGFEYGFRHPIGGLDHLLAMLAVGILAYVQGARALLLLPSCFAGMMLAGFALGSSQVDLPLVELGIALSGVVIGVLASTAPQVPLCGSVALVGTFAVFHGHAHGAEMPLGLSGLEYAAGFVAATASLLLCGIVGSALVANVTQRYGRTLVRVTGGAFAVGGVAILTGWL